MGLGRSRGLQGSGTRGEWENGFEHGKGKFVSADESVYEGTWEPEGSRDGKGVFYPAGQGEVGQEGVGGGGRGRNKKERRTGRDAWRGGNPLQARESGKQREGKTSRGGLVGMRKENPARKGDQP